MYLGINNLQFVDQRAFQRVKLDLNGRFLLLCDKEYKCIIHEMSPGGLYIIIEAFDDVIIGNNYTIIIDEIGHIEAKIIRFDSKRRGYALKILASENTKRKIAANITWISNKDYIRV
ncbi:PilZ domain-containing protein [Candidatus Liberibacter americanus]|uniref:PilZ domain-containing protein n=1 Tax=Candidatus Liberibacter americanus str. Sao Paulo TaxID=1261131 RepID=U6B487_9HYPH|nr:PilZ domain-containing protein [Candidatus Liberibacter americanus]AHA27879.1 hypothetical protein lam_526 [Candidatus Liberibacter americanus str. Sao Paulo]EMS36124.1 hypothetical protein G653_03391 [Candidatus Liberibacter americanus PW_SP]